MLEPIFPKDPDIESIDTLFRNRFFIPVFQRPYSWEKPEIDELFKDIFDYFFSRRNEELFVGSVYLSNIGQHKSNVNYYELIDGQQRITTLSLTALILYHHAIRLNKKDDRAVNDLKEYLWKIGDDRNPDRNLPLLTSGSLEQDIIKFIFDQIFSHAGEEECLAGIYAHATDNPLEQRIFDNMQTIDSNIRSHILKHSSAEDVDQLLDFVDFIIYNLRFITIVIDRSNIKKLFEVFESINSKGKQLSQIDLIKSYIFQNLDGSDYDEYLMKWGELIRGTDDNLEDYMYIFTKAFIRFYRNSIGAKYFRTLDVDLMRYYHKDNLSDALKSLLDDMVAKQSIYKMIIDEKIFLLPTRNEFKFYTMCLNTLEYKHPKPLLFRAYSEYTNGNISEEDVIRITKAAFTYMFTFQTIAKRDSKDAIEVFEHIMKRIYETGFDTKAIIEEFANSLTSEGINQNTIRNNLNTYNSYGDGGRILLLAYEFSHGQKIKYDIGNTILEKRKDIQIDHILPQTPERDDLKCYYYPEKNELGEEILRLRPGHDFNIPGIVDGMNYETFKNQVLNRLGNLKLMWGSDNRDKSNEIVQFNDYQDFNTYAQISTRGEQIIENLSENEIFKLPI